MAISGSYPTLSTEIGFDQYLRQVQDIPSLNVQEEYTLAKRLIENQDITAAHKLVTSHLKLVVKIAIGYRGYGLPLVDLISEGNLGLMQAVKKFDPELGNRLSTYAIWWIKASIQEYILKTWSLVKIGTTAAQKKLFFNLKKLKNKILFNENRELNYDEYKIIAEKLAISSHEVKEMDIRLSKSDLSLNSVYVNEGENELIDIIPETRLNQEVTFSNAQEYKFRKEILKRGLNKLDEREHDIIMQRRLKEDPSTLEELAKKHGISSERVRQIEVKAFAKLRSVAQNEE